MRLPVPIAQVFCAVAFFSAWQLASEMKWVDSELLPPFSVVVAAAVMMLSNADFLANAAATGLRIGTSFLIGAPLAVGLGLFLGQHLNLEKRVAPVFRFVMSVPQAIFLPIFVLALGIGFVEKVVYGVTHVLFIVSLTAMAAAKQVPKSYIDAARSFGWGRVDIYCRVCLPAMAPVIVTGLRLGLILNIIGVLLAEMYASQTGLGVLIGRWADAYDTQRTMAVLFLISCVTILLNEGMRVWENRVGRWSHEMGVHG